MMTDIIQYVDDTKGKSAIKFCSNRFQLGIIHRGKPAEYFIVNTGLIGNPRLNIEVLRKYCPTYESREEAVDACLMVLKASFTCPETKALRHYTPKGASWSQDRNCYFLHNMYLTAKKVSKLIPDTPAPFSVKTYLSIKRNCGWIIMHPVL